MLVCTALVIVILLQQGKGADIGAVFGGSSQTVFGSGGAGNFLTQLTAGLAVVYFATAIFLAYSSTRQVTGSVFGGGAASKSVMPAKAPAPVIPAAPAAPAGPGPLAPLAPLPEEPAPNK
jgi:preprotein translocase subunit SecG